ncbi:MAG: hypothetical protein QOD07_1751 [Frankiaceae bacterium]|nr:hypothetical protein [Frankiaceae bacterium]
MQVVSRTALTAAGYTWAQIQANLDGGRWRALNERVLCRHNGPLTRREQWAAAYLSCPQPAALAGPTAVEFWGIRGHEVTDVHVVVAPGARVGRVAAVPVVAHQSRRMSGRDLLAFDDVSVTEAHCSVIDACAWTADPAASARLLIAGVQQRRVWPDRLARALARAGQVRHAALLRRLLRDLSGGAEAVSEIEFLAFCRRHRLPRPQLQHRDGAGRRRRYLDARFDGSGGRDVFVEVDGGVHLTLATRWKDTRKDNWSSIAGKLVLRFPSVAIYTDDPEAVAQIRAALGLVRTTPGHDPGWC